MYSPCLVLTYIVLLFFPREILVIIFSIKYKNSPGQWFLGHLGYFLKLLLLVSPHRHPQVPLSHYPRPISHQRIDLILTIKFSIPQATQACSVHNPLERTNHKTPPTPQLQVGLGNLILSYNEKGRKLNKDKYLQSTFNMNCSKFAKQLYAVRMNVLILNTRGTID